jgi:hypothetical protein
VGCVWDEGIWVTSRGWCGANAGMEWRWAGGGAGRCEDGVVTSRVVAQRGREDGAATSRGAMQVDEVMERRRRSRARGINEQGVWGQWAGSTCVPHRSLECMGRARAQSVWRDRSVRWGIVGFSSPTISLLLNCCYYDNNDSSTYCYQNIKLSHDYTLHLEVIIQTTSSKYVK